MSKTDSLDKQLVSLLGRDARQSSASLAKQLKISAATVRRRLRKLAGGELLRIVGVIDPSKFGFPLAAIIALNVSQDKFGSVLMQLEALEEVRWISSTTGRFDIMLLARFPSTEDLSSFITITLAGMEGVKDSETFICLDLRKGTYVPYY